MVEKLIGAVAQKVRNEFGEKIEVYTESVHQNAVKPCFFIECEKCERVEMLNRNYFVRVQVAVTYENEGDEKKHDAQGVTAKLFDLLSCVMAEEVFFNGRKIHAKWEDGRLIVRAIYDMWPTMERETGTLMEAIEIKETFDGREIYEG